jgi:putative nucleotidyltransferase with HDIG domain
MLADANPLLPVNLGDLFPAIDPINRTGTSPPCAVIARVRGERRNGLMLPWIVLSVATLLLGGTSVVIWRRNRREERDAIARVDMKWEAENPVDLTSPAVTNALFDAPPEGARIRPEHASELEKSEMLDEVVRELDQIPPLPKAVHQILRELNGMGSTARSVATIVATEPVLVASLLRLVNSAAFGLRREILSIDEAVAYLGFSTVKTLVVRLKLGPLMSGGGTGVNSKSGYSPEKLWLHSVAVGQTAEHLAKRVGGVDPWLAGTIGLLHDIGKLAINSSFKKEVRKLWDGASGDESFLARERRIFGADHAFIGAYLAGKWNLPNDLVEAIRLHHMPADDPSVGDMQTDLLRATAVVHVANQLVKYSHVYCADMEIDIVPPRALKALGLPDDLEKVLDRQTKQVIERSVLLMTDPVAVQRNDHVRRAG